MLCFLNACFFKNILFNGEQWKAFLILLKKFWCSKASMTFEYSNLVFIWRYMWHLCIVNFTFPIEVWQAETCIGMCYMLSGTLHAVSHCYMEVRSYIHVKNPYSSFTNETRLIRQKRIQFCSYLMVDAAIFLVNGLTGHLHTLNMTT